MPTHPHLSGALLLSACLLALSLSGCDKPSSAAPPRAGAGEIIEDPNLLLSDTPPDQLALQTRRLGDTSQSNAQPFGEFVSFPYHYGVTNGRITSMVCVGDVLKSLDVEPTVTGLQMRLGKADYIEDDHDHGETTLFWYGRKRAAIVSGNEIKWFAVYK